MLTYSWPALSSTPPRRRRAARLNVHRMIPQHDTQVRPSSAWKEHNKIWVLLRRELDLELELDVELDVGLKSGGMGRDERVIYINLLLCISTHGTSRRSWEV